MKLNIKKIASPVLITIFPVVFLFANNSKEADINEALKLVVCFSCVAILITSIILLFLKFNSKAILISNALLIILGNYRLIESAIEKVFPRLYYWHILPILIFFWLVFSINIYRFLSQTIVDYILKITNIVFVSLLAFNVIINMPSLLTSNPVSSDKRTTISDEVISDALPDIYYILVDEYSNLDFMRKYYNFDNSDFEKFLYKNKFTLSRNSHNDSDQTLTVLTNILNLDYIVSDTTPQNEKFEMRQSSALYQILRKAGYEIVGVGNTDYNFAINSLTQDNKTSGIGNIRGETFSQIILKNTFIYPLITVDNRQRAENIISAFDYFNFDSNLKHSKPTFTILYVGSPHEPFLFDENGKSISPKDYFNWEDKRYYLNQYKYITKEMMHIIDCILAANPNCVIFASSDHSARFRNEFKSEDKKSPFHALYYCGEPIPEIDGKSGVNTWRTILNKLLDLGLDENIEVPGYE